MPTNVCLLNLRVLAMLLLIAVAFLLKRYGTQAIPLPVPDLTSDTFEAPSFARDNPSDGCHSRTVLDILWSCLATTFACTWVSVHPNVPFKGEGNWTILRRRIFLMFFSILAPEFMIMWAFKQWRGAVMIREAVNKTITEVSMDKDKPVRELWTTTHGHLLQMGGFRLRASARENFFWGGSTSHGFRTEPTLSGETSPIESQIDDRVSLMKSQYNDFSSLRGNEKRRTQRLLAHNLISGEHLFKYEEPRESDTSQAYEHRSQLELEWEGVLTFQTLKTLLSENLITFPTITEDEINDRSKGDALSKGIALLQLTWFIVQISTRAVQGLAITELELTTAALAGLNSVMYIFWWSKPRDVRFPVVIRTKGVEALLAGRTEDVRVAWSFSNQEFDIREHVWTSMTTWIKEAVQTAKTFPHRSTLFFSRVRSLLSRSRKPTMSENEDGILFTVNNEIRRRYENRTKRYALTLVHGVKYTTKSAFVPFLCLIYVIDIVLFIPIKRTLSSRNRTTISRSFFGGVGGFDAETEDKMFSMIFYSENAGVRPLLSTSSIAGALFGAIHCLAWNFSFPSHAEQILWRTASLGIVGSCVVIFLTVLCFDLIARLDYACQRFGLAPGGLATFVYPVARITLLVLSITSLRSLPPSALDTVDWVEFFPHI